MHEAFTCRLVLESARSIAALHAYGNKLLVCDSTCTLSHYTVEERIGEAAKGDAPEKAHVHTLRTVKQFSKGKPSQLHAIKETGALLVLVDGYISLYSLQSLELQQRLDDTKGATSFVVHSGIEHSSGIPVVHTRVAVCSKRQILLYTWLDSEFHEERHYTLPDRARAAEFLNDKQLVVGLPSDFIVLDISAGPTDGNVEAIQVQTIGGAMSTTMGYLGTRQPKPILSRTSGQMLLVRDIQSTLIDSDANIVTAKSIGWGTAPEHVGYTYPYLVVVLKNRVEIRNARLGTLLQHFDVANVQILNDGKSLFLATANKVYRLDAVPYAEQIESLIEADQLEQAQSVLEVLDAVLLDSKEGLLRRVKGLKARALIAEGEFDRGMELFGDSWATPSTVVDCLPEEPHSASAGKSGDESSSDEADVTQTSTADSSRKVTETLEAVSEDDSRRKAAFSAMAAYLARTRRLLARFISAPPERSSDDQYLTPWPECQPLTTAQLEHELEVADTTLLRVYIANSPSLVGSLVRLTNRCDPAVVREYLVREGRWRELVDFYASKKLFNDAFELLKEKDAVETAVQLMQRLDATDWAVIERWAPWLLENDPAAIDIFCEPSRENETFDRAAVARYLSRVGSRFATRYLEHLTRELGDSSPAFSEQLLSLYLEAGNHVALLEFLQSEHNSASPQRIYEKVPKDDATYLEVRAVLLAQMGRLRNALEIYVHEIGDADRTEAFAIRQHARNDEVFETLLDLYLAPGRPYISEALNVLKRHGPRVDAENVLRRLPESVSIEQIQSYLGTRLRDNLKHTNSGLIEAGLRRSDLVAAQAVLFDQRARHHIVTQDRLCASCGKRLANSVLAAFPNKALTHYGCQAAYIARNDAPYAAT